MKEIFIRCTTHALNDQQRYHLYELSVLIYFHVSCSKHLWATFGNFFPKLPDCTGKERWLFRRAGGMADEHKDKVASLSCRARRGLMCVNRKPSCPAWMLIQQVVKESCRLTDKGAVRRGQADMDSQSTPALVRCLHGLTRRLPVLSFPLSRG